MSARLAAAWMATLIGAAASGWLARGPAPARAEPSAVWAPARPALAGSGLPAQPAVPALGAQPSGPSQPASLSSPGLQTAGPADLAAALRPPHAATDLDDPTKGLLSGSDADRFRALARTRAEMRPPAPQVLQALLFGNGSSGLRLAALELWAEQLDTDPQAQQALFERALQVSDDAVRAEASARLEETLQHRQRMAGSP